MSFRFLALITISLVLTGTGCVTQAMQEWSTKDRLISDADLFARKQECRKYQEEIEAYINGQWNDEIHSSWLDKVFYSPKQNSCMYTMETWWNVDGVQLESHLLFDALTNERVESERGCYPESECGKSTMQASMDFRNLVVEYEELK